MNFRINFFFCFKLKNLWDLWLKKQFWTYTYKVFLCCKWIFTLNTIFLQKLLIYISFCYFLFGTVLILDVLLIHGDGLTARYNLLKTPPLSFPNISSNDWTASLLWLLGCLNICQKFCQQVSVWIQSRCRHWLRHYINYLFDDLTLLF